MRLLDNAALFNGSQKQNYEVIFIFDEDYWRTSGRSPRQLQFAMDCLDELDTQLQKFKCNIRVFCGNFSEFCDWTNKFESIQFHVNHSTETEYFRNHFCYFEKNTKHHISVYQDFGIQLDTFDRDHWSSSWKKIMESKTYEAPLPNKDNSSILNTLPNVKDWTKSQKNRSDYIQPGGTAGAKKLLHSFFDHRANGYRRKMSNPQEAAYACSRLSPHFSFGSISIRQVYQATLKQMEHNLFVRDLASFKKRLFWHCHFIQKLETEPELEFQSMHYLCDSLREKENDELIEKWILGKTGFPFLDACMLYLRKHGWINFRMRAMIMSFASYNLWQPWQKTSPLLAELFTDFEPGIHICQVQMQSGVTGINLPRIYSVIKQSIDQDPELTWTKSIISNLGSDKKAIHTASSKSYIKPIIDVKESARNARELVWGIRKSNKFKEIAKAVYLKHGSRRRAKTHN